MAAFSWLADRNRESAMLSSLCGIHTCTIACIRVQEQAETEWWSISFVDFFKVGFPVMIISLAVTNVYLFLMNFAFWQATAGQ